MEPDFFSSWWFWLAIVVGIGVVAAIAEGLFLLVSGIVHHKRSSRQISDLLSRHAAELDNPLKLQNFTFKLRPVADLACQRLDVDRLRALLTNTGELSPWHVLMERQVLESLPNPQDGPLEKSQFIIDYHCDACGKNYTGNTLSLETTENLTTVGRMVGGNIEYRMLCPQGHDVIDKTYSIVN